MSEAPTTLSLSASTSHSHPQHQHHHHPQQHPQQHHHRISRSDFSLIDDDTTDANGGFGSPQNEGQHMFLQVVEYLRLEKEVWILFIETQTPPTPKTECVHATFSRRSLA